MWICGWGLVSGVRFGWDSAAGVLGIFWFWVVWVGFSCARCCYVSLLFCSRLAAGSGRLWRACFVVGLGDFV